MIGLEAGFTLLFFGISVQLCVVMIGASALTGIGCAGLYISQGAVYPHSEKIEPGCL